MTKHTNANLIPYQYIINEKDGDRFIFAQPDGEKHVIIEKPSAIKIIAVAILAAAALVSGLAVWLMHQIH
jgi:hypothetical protein